MQTVNVKVRDDYPIDQASDEHDIAIRGRVFKARYSHLGNKAVFFEHAGRAYYLFEEEYDVV